MLSFIGRCALPVASGLVAVSSFVTAQNEPIRVDTKLVTVPVAVMDRNGRYLTGLQRKDFTIYENGLEQKLSFFSPVEERFTVFLLLDVSGSMANHIEHLATAANTFLSQLRPDDQMIAAVFAGEVALNFDLTTVQEVRKKRIQLRGISGPPFTRLYDAVAFAQKKMRKIPGRKAIVLFSDGAGDGDLFASAKGTLREAEEGESLIYTVQFDTFPATPPEGVSRKAWYKSIADANEYMQDLAAKSGGRSFRVEGISDLTGTFGAVADELGRQYSLGYYPTKPGVRGERRRIKVTIGVPNAVVKSRSEVAYHN